MPKNFTTMATNNNNLVFLETLTMDQFKKRVNADKIQIKQKPGSDKLYFTYKDEDLSKQAMNGPICLTEDGKVPSPAMVSLVQGEDIDPYHPEAHGKFWMVHKEAQPTVFNVVGEW